MCMSCTYLFITNPYGLVIFSVCYLCLDKTSMFTVRFSINKAEITSGGKFLGDRINNLTKARDLWMLQGLYSPLPSMPFFGTAHSYQFHVFRSRELAHFLWHVSLAEPIRVLPPLAHSDEFRKGYVIHTPSIKVLWTFLYTRDIKRDFYLLFWIQSCKTVVSMELFIDNLLLTTKRVFRE